MVKLGDIIAKVKSGKTNSTEISNSGDYDFYGCTAKVPTGKHNRFDFEGDEYLLFAKSGGNAKTKVGENLGIGKFHYVTGKTAGNIAVYQYVIRDTDKVSYRYLYHILRSKLSEIQMLADYTTGNGNINIENMYSLVNIPVPSIERQRQIVAQLNWAQLAQQEEQALKMIETQVMFHIKETSRGEPLVKLGDVCEIRNGKNLTKEQLNHGDVPVIGGGVSPMGYHNIHNREAYAVVLAQVGSAGNVSRYPVKSWITNNGMTIHPKGESIANDDILYYALKNIQDEIKQFAEGTAQPKLSAASVFAIEIPLPPLAEQQSLQSDIDEIRHKHEKIIMYKAKAQDAIRRLIPGAGA